MFTGIATSSPVNPSFSTVLVKGLPPVPVQLARRLFEEELSQKDASQALFPETQEPSMKFYEVSDDEDLPATLPVSSPQTEDDPAEVECLSPHITFKDEDDVRVMTPPTEMEEEPTQPCSPVIVEEQPVVVEEQFTSVLGKRSITPDDLPSPKKFEFSPVVEEERSITPDDLPDETIEPEDGILARETPDIDEVVIAEMPDDEVEPQIIPVKRSKATKKREGMEQANALPGVLICGDPFGNSSFVWADKSVNALSLYYLYGNLYMPVSCYFLCTAQEKLQIIVIENGIRILFSHDALRQFPIFGDFHAMSDESKDLAILVLVRLLDNIQSLCFTKANKQPSIKAIYLISQILSGLSIEQQGYPRVPLIYVPYNVSMSSGHYRDEVWTDICKKILGFDLRGSLNRHVCTVPRQSSLEVVVNKKTQKLYSGYFYIIDYIVRHVFKC